MAKFKGKNLSSGTSERRYWTTDSFAFRLYDGRKMPLITKIHFDFNAKIVFLRNLLCVRLRNATWSLKVNFNSQNTYFLSHITLHICTYVYNIFIYALWPLANLNFIAKIHHADAAIAILINILNFSSSCRYIGTLWTREMLNVHSAEWFTFHSKILLLINITYLYMYFSCDLNPELNESRIQFVCTWAENYMYYFFS